MPVFTLISREHRFEPERFVAQDSGQVLGMIHRLGWNSADVRRDDQYLFSVALNRYGVWSITNRPL